MNERNNYLSNHEWKTSEMIELDEGILIDLSYKSWIHTIDELREFTDKQISDLIEFWDANESHFSELKMSKGLGELIKNKKDNSDYLEKLDDKKEKISEKVELTEKLLDFASNLELENIWDYEDFWKTDEEIVENISNFLNKKWNKFYHFDLTVDKQENEIEDEVLKIIPDRISRFAFDREWFTWIRYYVFEQEKWDYKICIWFYWWSAWRWNDMYFKNIFEKNKDRDNVEKVDLKLSFIINVLRLKNKNI